MKKIIQSCLSRILKLSAIYKENCALEKKYVKSINDLAAYADRFSIHTGSQNDFQEVLSAKESDRNILEIVLREKIIMLLKTIRDSSDDNLEKDVLKAFIEDLGKSEE